MSDDKKRSRESGKTYAVPMLCKEGPLSKVINGGGGDADDGSGGRENLS
jgi:hypothetical protein